jgi:hypothetical protein
MREKRGLAFPVSVISANVIACEDILTEKTEIFSAVKILSAYKISRETMHLNFYSLAIATSTPGDYSRHVMSVQMKTPAGLTVAAGADYQFNYGYKIDPLGYGGFSLKTKFTLELSKLPPELGWFFLWVYVDGEPVAKTVFTLRWI